MATNITLELERNSSNNRLESGAVIDRTLVINGSGFGGAPNVVIYADFTQGIIGNDVPLGQWTSGLYGESNRPKYIALGSTSGFGSRTTDVVGFVKQSAAYSDFFTAFKMGVPDGYYFSGASSGRTLPPASNLKMGWHSDQALDNPILADIVSTSRVDPSNWAIAGNQTTVSLYNGGAFDWNTSNCFAAYHKSGASPFVNNGTARSIISTSAGTTTTSDSSAPLFKKLVGFVPTVADSTLYTVTIDGTACNFISGVSATITTICTGLVSAINASGVTSASASNIDSNSDGVSEGFKVTAVIGQNPTVTCTGNLTMTTQLPQFTQISTNWQGNNNQTNTMHVFTYFYVATGANCGNAIAIGNASTKAACTDLDFLNPTWSDTQITAVATAKQKAGKTHWFRFSNGDVVDSGAISWQ